jgi:hypothetical protein
MLVMACERSQLNFCNCSRCGLRNNAGSDRDRPKGETTVYSETFKGTEIENSFAPERRRVDRRDDGIRASGGFGRTACGQGFAR